MWRLASLKLSTSNLVSGEIYASISGAWPGVRLPPHTRLQAGDWKRDPRGFSTDSPILLKRTELSRGLPPLKGRRVCQGDAVGGYDLHLAHEGPTAERTSSSPKRARLTRPSTPGQE